MFQLLLNSIIENIFSFNYNMIEEIMEFSKCLKDMRFIALDLRNQELDFTKHRRLGGKKIEFDSNIKIIWI